MLTIALYGDSITRGVTWDEGRGRYVYLKESFDKLMEAAGTVNFINHSRFGATAAEGFAEFELEKPVMADVLAIAYGGNDCTPDWKAVAENPEASHPARTGLDEFKSVLTRFVSKAREQNKKAVLVTPPPLVAERFVPWISRGLDAGAIQRYLGDIHHVYRWQEQYALAVHQVARHAQCLLFDMRASFLRERDLGSLYCIDGMHPNGKGHQLIASAASAQLPELIAAL